jgi:hypothetical protein
VDKSLLEANGIAVHLLNDRSPPSDIVFPLPIELQVPDEQFPQAVAFFVGGYLALKLRKNKGD